ncbi:MAG: hypothetical protein MO853_02245 [Candidatus Protistobacter heckmanni]|nr:hypothetical protein [Candidatus Protistobacter heckmanni]
MNWLRQSGSEIALANLFGPSSKEKEDPDANKLEGCGQKHPVWFTGKLRDAYLKAWAHRGEDGSHGLTGGVNYYRASPLHPPTDSQQGAAGIKLDPAMFRVKVKTRVI